MAVVVDPALFLYLNPEVEAQQPTLTADQAAALYLTMSNAKAALDLPSHFVSTTYLLDSSKANADISGLNRVIAATMCNLTDAVEPQFLPTVHRHAVYLDRGRFRVYDAPPEDCDCCEGVTPPPAWAVPPTLVQAGDVLRVFQDDVFARDAEVLSVNSNVIALDEDQVWPPCSRYVIHGIGLHDVDRMAHVLYSRAPPLPPVPASEACPCHSNGGAMATPMEDFNPELYRTLYQDARHMTDAEAYVDSRLRPERVTHHRELARLPAAPAGVSVVGVSVDSVTPHTALDPAAQLLATEYALKRYVDLKSNWVAPFEFLEPVTACNGITVKSGDLVCNNGGMLVTRGDVFSASSNWPGTAQLRAPFVFDEMLVYGVSRDSSTPHFQLHAGNQFITEYAIKRYVDHKRHWDQPAIFSDAVTALRGFVVGGDAPYLSPGFVHACACTCNAPSAPGSNSLL